MIVITNPGQSALRVFIMYERQVTANGRWRQLTRADSRPTGVTTQLLHGSS